MSTNTEKASWLAGLLTGWGIKESWAKIIAGAVIGALAACGFLTSCSQVQKLTPEQMQQIYIAGEQAHEAYHALTGKPCKFESGTLIYVPADGEGK